MRSPALKRLIDIVGSAVGLLVAAIPMGLLASLIRRDLGRPVLFRQTRPGRDGRPFTLVKFVGSSRVDLQACKLEYSIVSPK